MTPLILTLRRPLSTWLDMSPLTPERLQGLSQRRLGDLRLQHGRQQVAVRELFDMRPGDCRHIQIRRAHACMVAIGDAMSSGRIEIRGHAGQYLGRRMTGGSIYVRGDAGDWAAAGLAGGTVEIEGNAGDFLGGPLPGAVHGMSAGMVSVLGRAGERAGDRMRRGTIVIFGDAGDCAGSRMIAGTLMILGRCGRQVGRGMRRGTIILGKKPAHMLSTFHSCGILKMEFLRLLFKQMASMNRHMQVFRQFGPEVHRYAGDSARRGRGELLVLLNGSARRAA